MEPVRPFYLPSFEKEAEAIVARIEQEVERESDRDAQRQADEEEPGVRHAGRTRVDAKQRRDEQKRQRECREPE